MKEKAFTVWMAMRPAGREAEHDGVIIWSVNQKILFWKL